MRLLVTGGSGFIGSNFINYWLEHNPNHKVVNLDALTYAGNPNNTKDFKDHPNYTFVHGNILDQEIVDSLMETTDTVVHFAAESHVDRSIENPKVFLESNLMGTYNLLESARKHKINRFHHVSTDEVFGYLNLESDKKFDEEMKYNPRNPYAASKAAADHIVSAYYHTYNLPVTISNCSNNYGSKQSVEKFIPRSITNLLNGIPVKLYGDGKFVRDWLYVEDHCRAIDLIINKGKLGETYLIGGQENEIDNVEVANTLLEILNLDRKYLEFVKDRPGHDRRYSVDFGKIQKDLGWSPSYTFKEGIEKTVDWYKSNEWYWKEDKNNVESFYTKIGR